MADPVIVQCPANIWTLVAENVTAGSIKKIGNGPGRYLETYRMTGGAAPTDQAEGAIMFINGPSEIIEAAAGIDVYVMACGSAGAVRRDV